MTTSLIVLEACGTSTRIKDKDGDVWRRRSDGYWYLHGAMIGCSTAELVTQYGPVEILT